AREDDARRFVGALNVALEVVFDDLPVGGDHTRGQQREAGLALPKRRILPRFTVTLHQPLEQRSHDLSPPNGQSARNTMAYIAVKIPAMIDATAKPPNKNTPYNTINPAAMSRTASAISANTEPSRSYQRHRRNPWLLRNAVHDEA